MTVPYNIHEKAKEDYSDAFIWYEDKVEGLGIRFMLKVEERINFISKHPEYFSKRYGNFREAKVKDFPFMIVYEFFENEPLIHISAIHHCKKHPRKKLRKKS